MLVLDVILAVDPTDAEKNFIGLMKLLGGMAVIVLFIYLMISLFEMSNTLSATTSEPDLTRLPDPAPEQAQQFAPRPTPPPLPDVLPLSVPDAPPKAQASQPFVPPVHRPTRVEVQAEGLTSAAVAPPGKMYLKIRRSQRATMLGGKAIFILDARVDLSAQDLNLVNKYGLASQVIYDSKERKAHTENAYDHFTHQQVLSAIVPGRALWKGVRGLWSSARMLLALRVTVKSLVAGQRIECKDLPELLGAEKAIREACDNLRGYLDVAATFDGREELVEI
jgi:hypothetical protein